MEKIIKKGANVQGDHALMETNGFVVRRDLIPKELSEQYADRLKMEIPSELMGKSVSDACNKLEFARSFLQKDHLSEAMKGLIPSRKFLQVADVQLNHNRDNWHRDSACRAFGMADWNESSEPYRVYKVIVYLRSEFAGLAVIPGSHRAKVRAGTNDEEYTVIPASEAVDRPLTDGKNSGRYVVGMKTGDALIFDERLLHCGRRYNAEGKVVDSFLGPKTTIAYVFGEESRHSWRFYSYFRFLRTELKFKELENGFVESLREADMLPNFFRQNLFAVHPEELANITGK